MGQGRSKESRTLAKKTHFSSQEIDHLRQDVEAAKSEQNSITEGVFKEVVKRYVPSVSSQDEAFLHRLYNAFDVDNDKQLAFSEFVDGLSVFMKGTPEEKMKLSFKLYDVDHDGYLTRPELERVLLQLSSAFQEKDYSADIIGMVQRVFDDLDVDNDGKLSYEEYKLSAMKEPLIVDYLEQFLDYHNLSTQPRAPSRPPSVRSHISTRSAMLSSDRPGSQHRLSTRLSQADLLDAGYQQQFRSSYTPTSSSTHSPKSSILFPPSPVASSSQVAVNEQRPVYPRRLSRGTSLASLDAAINGM